MSWFWPMCYRHVCHFIHSPHHSLPVGSIPSGHNFPKYADFVSIILIGPIELIFVDIFMMDLFCQYDYLKRFICSVFSPFFSYSVELLLAHKLRYSFWFLAKNAVNPSHKWYFCAKGGQEQAVDCTKCEKWILVILSSQLCAMLKNKRWFSRKRMKETQEKETEGEREFVHSRREIERENTISEIEEVVERGGCTSGVKKITHANIEKY